MLFMFILTAFFCQSQTKFETGSWEQIKQKATQEEKLIFVDLYFTGCAPCAMMDAQVFPNKEVSEYLNTHFIAFKSDIFKEDIGKKLSMKYGVTGFPTFLFLNARGKIVDIFSGFHDSEAFTTLLDAVRDKASKGIYKKYSTSLEGNYPDFYIDAYMKNKRQIAFETMNVFLKGEKDLGNEIPFVIISGLRVGGSYAEYLLDNAQSLAEDYSRMQVRNSIMNIITNKAISLGKTNDADSFRLLLNKIKPIFTEIEWTKFEPMFHKNSIQVNYKTKYIMKLHKALLAIPIAIFLVSFNSYQGAKNDYTIIKGILDIPNKTEIKLSKVQHGKLFEVGSSILNNNKEFGFAISPDQEGFYILGDRDIEIPLYIKGGQTFNIKYSTDGYELIDAPDKENNILYNWVRSNDTLKVFDFRYRGSSPKTYKDFFPFYESFIPKMQEQHKMVTSKNPRFNELMHTYIDLNIEHQALYFLFTPRVEHPKAEDMASFYNDFMKGDNFKSAIVLDVPKGVNSLRLHQMYKVTYLNKIDRKETVNWMVQNVKNDTLRGYLALEYVKGFKAYDSSYLAYMEPLRKDIALSDYLSKEIDAFEIGIKTMSSGTPGYPFTYKDQNGKAVSFSDFKGKYVYIDVWATWCAPCKAQIPHIKQLEKDLHGKNIQFVSISMDKQKDHEKWKQFIKDNELTGVQLFSDDAFNTRIAKDYKINAIPRFLLFDPEGNIIDADAKRPSDPELKKQLESLLK